MSCDDAFRAFFSYLDGACAGEQLEALEAHIAACLDCCDRLEFSRRLDTFVKARMGQAPLPSGAEERIRRALGL